jgi:hypothetical protein
LGQHVALRGAREQPENHQPDDGHGQNAPAGRNVP